jgi:hypothetical protein
VNILSVGNPKRLLKLIIFAFITMLVGLGLAVTPAKADEVGTEFSDAVT